MRWTKLKVHIKPEAVDAVSDGILGLGIEGIQIEDNFLSEEDRASMFVDYTADELIPLDEYRIVVYLDETMDVDQVNMDIENEVQRIREFMDVGSGSITVELMPDEDYENKWKEYYQPFRVGDHMVITPIWETPEVEADDVLIKINPGMAFGSGTHETTSMCVEMLQSINLSDKSVLDIGTGSGILGIVAAKLGAQQVVAVDIDPNAVTVAKENAVSNDVSEVMVVKEGDLLDQVTGRSEVVVANILADVIIGITEPVKQVITKGGIFISSGILASRAEEVKMVLEESGYEVLHVVIKGEWAAIKATINE